MVATDGRRLALASTPVDVKKDSKVADLVSKIVGTLVKYPTHFVLQTKFTTEKSVFMRAELQNLEAVNMIYDKVKTDYVDQKI